MPFIPHTPESLINRSDSKNPATTCKGITTEGRHCRRDIASPPSSPGNRRASKAGVVAILAAGDEHHDGAAAYFCFQHKDQAHALATEGEDGRRANLVSMQGRTSIDTLAERIGILEMDEEDPHKRKPKLKRQLGKQARKETLPSKWQDMEGPLLAVPDQHTRHSKYQSRPSQSKAKKSRSNVGLFCCIRSVESPEPLPPSRPVTATEKPTRSPNRVAAPAGYRPSPASNRNSQVMPSSHPSPNRQNLAPHDRRRSYAAEPSTKRNSLQSVPSQTQNLLSLIPTTLPPSITSALLAELAKPPSALDGPGYIYIFWLTDAADVPDDDTASLLIGDGSNASKGRPQSEILQRYPSKRKPKSSTANAPTTVMLKIGRAANVQRRMNQVSPLPTPPTLYLHLCHMLMRDLVDTPMRLQPFPRPLLPHRLLLFHTL